MSDPPLPSSEHVPGVQTPVCGSLAAAVAELGSLAASAEQLQVALSPLLRRGGDAVEAAQTLDDMTQHLYGLAEFLEALAAQCPSDWRLDLSAATARLRLNAQKLRLTFSASPSSRRLQPPSPGSGDFELL